MTDAVNDDPGASAAGRLRAAIRWIVGVGVLLLMAGIAAHFGWMCARKVDAAGSEWLPLLWTLLGLFAAAGYALTWNDVRGDLPSWLTLPLGDRQLVLRLTRLDRWLFLVGAALAILVGSGFAAGSRGGVGPASLLEVLVAPCLVAAASFPLGLLLVRVGKVCSWILMVAVVAGSMTLLAAGVRVDPDRWLPWLLGGTATCALLGWTFLGALPGRAHLRRLVDRSGSARAAQADRPAEQASFDDRATWSAALLLQERDPRRRLRRLGWLPAIALGSTASTWLVAVHVPILPPPLPALAALAAGWWLIHRRPSRARGSGVPAFDPDEVNPPGRPWMFLLDPLPIRPREVATVELRHRAPAALGLAVAALLLPSLLLPILGLPSLDLHLLAMLAASPLLGVTLLVCAGSLPTYPPERPPAKPLWTASTQIGVVTGLLVFFCGWLLRDTLHDGLVEALAAPATQVWLERASGWLHLVDIRLLAAIVCFGPVVLAALHLRALVRKREERSTDVWP